MSVQSVSVNVCGEVNNLFQVVLTILQDVKSGKTPAQVVTDAVPSLVSALSGLGDLKTEIADHKDLEATVALNLSQIINVFVP